MAIREKAFEGSPLAEEELHVKQWDVTVLVREMTAEKRTDIQNRALKTVKGEQTIDFRVFTPLLVIASTFDPETREPVFEEGDTSQLLQCSSSALEAISQVAMRLSGITEEELTAAKNG